MRAMWSGAVSFGLVSVPIKLYTATTRNDIRFHQVHEADGGRIKYKRVCSVCSQEIDYADIVKGYETEDGELIMLTEPDLEALPVASGHEIDVIEFVPAEQIDPLLLDKSYYLEPEPKAAKPYALLREALRETDRMAVVKVALRQRETLALLRVRDKAIVLQTMLWPDEVREPDFEILETEVELRPQEMQMASSLIDSLGADFDPSGFSDDYRHAVEDLIERKRTTGDAKPVPAPAPVDNGVDSMTDLLTALQRSVEAATKGKSVSSEAPQTMPEAGSKQAGKSGAKKAAPGKRAAKPSEDADQPAPRKRARTA